MGGTISAVASVLDLAVAKDVTDSAFFYFLTADMFILLCIIMYLILPKLVYSRSVLTSQQACTRTHTHTYTDVHTNTQHDSCCFAAGVYYFCSASQSAGREKRKQEYNDCRVVSCLGLQNHSWVKLDASPKLRHLRLA